MKMKTGIGTYSLLVVGLILCLTGRCKKEEPLTLAELSTIAIKGITSTSVITGVSIFSDGGSFITARGVCWSETPNPTIFNNCTADGEGAGKFETTITGLTGGTVYFMRAYATNNKGTAYGNEFLFTTPLTDIDGNIYNIVTIGEQIWMTQNLRTTKFSDNSDIPQVTDNAAWSTISTPAFCWYKNDEFSNKQNYGALYNWFAVNTGKLCPTGWHVPSEKEWMALTDNLGGEFIASGKLKEVGKEHWMDPNDGATNDYGFTALPGGYRTGLAAGSFRARGYLGYWWGSTEYDLTGARARLMTYDTREIARGTALKKNGYSVRCVRDNYQY
jgi:uncharacterized protein (TIGR02145 family)